MLEFGADRSRWMLALPPLGAIGIACSATSTSSVPAVAATGVAAGDRYSHADARGRDPSSGGARDATVDSGRAGSGDSTMLDGPIARGDFCVLEFGDIFFQVDWRRGARVTSVKVGGSEILTDSRLNALNYGSTFWTAPQSDWHWPPVAEIDSAEYQLAVAETSCSVTGPLVTSSSASNLSGIRVTKRFTPDFSKHAVVIDYTVENPTGQVKSLAPWEITRVAPGGLTFYASDSAPMVAGTRPLMPTTSRAGATFFKHDANTPKDSKLNADGKGWLAHVTPEKVILIKSFPDILQSQAALGEAEVEIYAADNAAAPASYVEVENQGAYASIPAGSSLTWTVRWYLRKLPETISATAGNPDLVAFVASTLR